EDGKDAIDEKLAIDLVRHAIDSGVNYLDTAYCYDGSEALLGKALGDGYREKVHIATKLPVWEAKSYEDYGRLFNEELTRLNTDYIDIYLLHCLNKENWASVKKLGGTRFLDQLYEEGKIKLKGFSFHGDYELFKEIVDAYDWDMCLIQLNYLDQFNQAGINGIKYAAAKGMPVVVMEPLKGGLLSGKIPGDALNLINEFPVKRTPSEWAFRWVYNNPEVKVVLSGVNTMEQLNENLEIFNEASPNIMDEGELGLIEKIREAFISRLKVGCTGCRYCIPCPAAVNIPEIFKIYNDSALFEELEFQKRIYNIVAVSCGEDASKCVECRKCEALCPQGIDIVNKLKEAHEVLGCP
ncbi:MAG TPA: aldo/keto reductase, partial [Clostridia bacterium]